MSGIPFGLIGEMLQDGGNLWRGMLYGMTNRLPWAGDPRPIWKFWDEAGIAGTRMLGWWVPSNPVRTGREDVLATVYQGKAHSIVALGSWAKDPVNDPGYRLARTRHRSRESQNPGDADREFSGGRHLHTREGAFRFNSGAVGC